MPDLELVPAVIKPAAPEAEIPAAEIPAAPTPIAPFTVTRTRRCLLPVGNEGKSCTSYLNHLGPCRPNSNVPPLVRDGLAKASKKGSEE